EKRSARAPYLPSRNSLIARKYNAIELRMPNRESSSTLAATIFRPTSEVTPSESCRWPSRFRRGLQREGRDFCGLGSKGPSPATFPFQATATASSLIFLKWSVQIRRDHRSPRQAQGRLIFGAIPRAATCRVNALRRHIGSSIQMADME